MFPSSLRAIKDCNQQLWKFINTAVLSLHDKDPAVEQLVSHKKALVQQKFADSLSSALRFFAENGNQVFERV